MKSYAVTMAILLTTFSANINADKFYWLIGDLSKIKMSETVKSENILAKVAVGSIMEIPVSWTAALCDFNKNIVPITVPLESIDSIFTIIAPCGSLCAATRSSRGAWFT